MNVGENYIAFHCVCGHQKLTWIADWPPETRHCGISIHDEALERLRCSACGRRGRPQNVILGWSAGPKPGREHVRERKG